MRQVDVGAVSIKLPIFIEDSRSGDGAGLPGLVFNSSGLVCYYRRDDQAAFIQVTPLVTATPGTYTSAGFIATDGGIAALAGCYELDLPNAAWTSGRFVQFMLAGAANMVPYVETIQMDRKTAIDSVLDTALSDPTGPLPQNASIRQRVAWNSHLAQWKNISNATDGYQYVHSAGGIIIAKAPIIETATTFTRDAFVIP